MAQQWCVGDSPRNNRDEWLASVPRHGWIFAGRVRPLDPHFARCPMPREGLGHEEQNAELILSYFHPFSMHEPLSDKHVPHLNQLRNAGVSWQETLLQWFDGKVLCNESKVYFDHFLAVTRAGFFDDEQGEHSEGNFSDEELCVDKTNFSVVLKTVWVPAE